MPVELGFTTYGHGALRVLVLHDWFCDHSSWDATLAYLTPDRFTYLFADLRGYGRSLHIAGKNTLDEAAEDALAVADTLGWSTFSLIGHSMSGLIVQRIAQLAPERIARLVAITPVSPSGMGLPQPAVDQIRGLALADDDRRFAALRQMWGDRLSETWIRFKLKKWRETASAAAAANYVEMWGCSHISQDARGLRTPMLVIAAAQDSPPFQAAALEASMLPWYPNAKLISLSESGHYPMQEQPPMIATIIERFLTE
jgi:3-oxoadipate enol-lactonase